LLASGYGLGVRVGVTIVIPHSRTYADESLALIHSKLACWYGILASKYGKHLRRPDENAVLSMAYVTYPLANGYAYYKIKIK